MRGETVAERLDRILWRMEKAGEKLDEASTRLNDAERALEALRASLPSRPEGDA